jgi:chromosome segregation ATPase
MNAAMNNRVGLIVLVLICLGLVIALIAVKKQASDLQHEDEAKISALSNKWVKTSNDLDEQRGVAVAFEKDLEKQREVFAQLTNTYSQLSANMSETTANLTKTTESLKAAEEEVKKRDARISDLENQNQALDKQALDLSNSITNLTTQIADTQRKLTSSEGDKAFLEKELKRMMTEKAELERQFNDITVLRAQVTKLKEELSIARRLEWIRRGLFASTEQKGAQKLMTGINQGQTKVSKPSYDLNVEVSADGTVRVVPPATNAPAPTPQPAK